MAAASASASCYLTLSNAFIWFQYLLYNLSPSFSEQVLIATHAPGTIIGAGRTF